MAEKLIQDDEHQMDFGQDEKVAELPKHSDNQFTYDMVMVFKLPNEEVETPPLTGPDIVKKLEKAGLKTSLYQSVQHDEIYCLIGATEERLNKEALRINMDLELDPQAAIDLAYKKGVRLARAVKSGVDTESTEFITGDIFDDLYGRYKNTEEAEKLYVRFNEDGPFHRNSLFRSKDRINLIVSIVEAPATQGGAQLSLEDTYAMKNTELLAFFPLHESEKLEALKEKWSKLLNWYHGMPLDDIRNYFGEKIALYFAWLETYTLSLLIPSFLGVFFYIYQVATDVVSASGVWVYALVIIFWSSGFLEYWKRKQARLRAHWGMTNFSRKEQTRPRFFGRTIISPIDGDLDSYFPLSYKLLRIFFSQTVLFTLITLVIACVAGVFLFRIFLKDTVGGTEAVVYGAFVNFALITIFNIIYGKVSFFLNEFENHKTDSEFENALIAKTFLFKFVNSYNTLFYIAFVKDFLEDEGCVGSCLGELRLQLFIIFGSALVVNNTLEVFVPYLASKYKEYTEGDIDDFGGKLEMSFPEQQFLKAKYESTFADFDELAIQFGYVVLFVVAFPIAPILAFGNNIIEMGVDSNKLLRATRRPEPRGAYDIGTWISVFNNIASIGILTNVALCVFLLDEVTEWTDYTDDRASVIALRCGVAVILEHVVFGIKLLIDYFVPDVPEEVTNLVARQKYITDVLIDGEDIDEPEVEEGEVDFDPEKLMLQRQASSLVDQHAEKFDLNTISEQMNAEGHDIS